MFRSILIGLIVGTSLSLGGLFIDSASAQTAGQGSDNGGGNLSDIGGGNLSDIGGGNISDIGGTGTFDITPSNNSDITPSIVSLAEQLAGDIARASAGDTANNIRPASNNQSQRNTANSRCQLRRFSLDRPDPNRNRNCSRADNSESGELNTLLNRADEFLEDIERKVETANSEIAKNRLW